MGNHTPNGYIMHTADKPAFSRNDCLFVAAPPLLGLAAVVAVRIWVFHIPMHRLGLLSCFVLVAFAATLWIRATAVQPVRPHSRSWVHLAISIVSYSIASIDVAAGLQKLALLLGTLSGCVILIPATEIIRQARSEPSALFVAALLAAGYALYPSLNESVWYPLSRGTANSLACVFGLIGLDASVVADRGIRILLASRQFRVNVYEGCSGLEGMLLFLGLYHMLVLWDYEIFKKTEIWGISLLLCCLAFILNAIRIGALFLLGYYAHHPLAGPLMVSLQGIPLLVFHSSIGFVIYLLAFAATAPRLYLYAHRASSK